jgi:hypothetical protein
MASMFGNVGSLEAASSQFNNAGSGQINISQFSQSPRSESKSAPGAGDVDHPQRKDSAPNDAGNNQNHIITPSHPNHVPASNNNTPVAERTKAPAPGVALSVTNDVGDILSHAALLSPIPLLRQASKTVLSLRTTVQAR